VIYSKAETTAFVFFLKNIFMRGKLNVW